MALVANVAFASVFVLPSPVDPSLVERHRLSGKVFEWQWARRFSPFVNLNAAAFLIDGSAARFDHVEVLSVTELLGLLLKRLAETGRHARLLRPRPRLVSPPRAGGELPGHRFATRAVSTLSASSSPLRRSPFP